MEKLRNQLALAIFAFCLVLPLVAPARDYMKEADIANESMGKRPGHVYFETYGPFAGPNEIVAGSRFGSNGREVIVRNMTNRPVILSWVNANGTQNDDCEYGGVEYADGLVAGSAAWLLNANGDSIILPMPSSSSALAATTTWLLCAARGGAYTGSTGLIYVAWRD